MPGIPSQCATPRTRGDILVMPRRLARSSINLFRGAVSTLLRGLGSPHGNDVGRGWLLQRVLAVRRRRSRRRRRCPRGIRCTAASVRLCVSDLALAPRSVLGPLKTRSTLNRLLAGSHQLECMLAQLVGLVGFQAVDELMKIAVI